MKDLWSRSMVRREIRAIRRHYQGCRFDMVRSMGLFPRFNRCSSKVSSNKRLDDRAVPPRRGRRLSKRILVRICAFVSAQSSLLSTLRSIFSTISIKISRLNHSPCDTLTQHLHLRRRASRVRTGTGSLPANAGGEITHRAPYPINHREGAHHLSFSPAC